MSFGRDSDGPDEQCHHRRRCRGLRDCPRMLHVLERRVSTRSSPEARDGRKLATNPPDPSRIGREVSVWALFTLSARLGVLGLVMAYKRNWAAIVPVLAVLAIAAATIVQLRDPLSLTPARKRRTSKDCQHASFSHHPGTRFPFSTGPSS